MSEAPPIRRDGRSSFKQMLVRLRGRPDSEHEMSFNRMAMIVATISYILLAQKYPEGQSVSIAYTIISLAAFIHILIDPAARVWRRLFMMTVDVVGLSHLMHANDIYAAGFWPLYLWTIFGNGFRFGNSYLFATALMSIVCFGAVIMTTPFWQANMALSIGLLIGLIILPAYAAKLVGKLSKAKREAEEASRAKSYFLASVSHELRTPLTAIIGLGAHLQATDIPDEEKGMAGTIVTAGRSLLSLINQLLDFSRLGAKGITAESKPFDLMLLLISVRELMKVTAQEKGLRIALHVTSRTPLMLKGDEGHLRDVIVNLLGNALKFTERGSVTISADAERIPTGELRLTFAVTDTGIGIAAEAQEHIFDSFRQADNSIIDRFGGTGLGLAICKQVVELLGGEIGVDSEPGEGSRFWFTAQVEDASIEQAVELADGGQLVLFSSDAALAEGIRTTLEPNDIALEVATSLEQVRALAQRDSSAKLTAIVIDEEELRRRAIPMDSLRESLDHGAAPLLFQRTAAPAEHDPAVERAFISVVNPASDVDDLTRALRIAATAAAGPNAIMPAPVEQIEPARRRLRVLVADDNVMNQKVFAMILNRAGHEVDAAGDGEAALDILKNQQHDVVLMDVNMPVLNGIETTKLYRFASLGRRRIPIIGVTADASPETAERCIEAGMDACVSKPVDAPALLRLVESLTQEATNPTGIIFDPSGVVTPLFPEKRDEMAAIDWSKLADLQELGGDDFVVDLLHEYVSDAETLLAALAESVASDNVKAFRDGTHALRSSGANIGAEKLAHMCLHFQRIDRVEFEAKGRLHLKALEEELDRVRQALAEHAPGLQASHLSQG